MPTKRRRVPPRQIGLSERALAAWRAGDKIILHRELGLRPWQLSPFDATGARDDELVMPGYYESWPRAVELRARLIEIAGQPGKVGRHGRPARASDADEEA